MSRSLPHPFIPEFAGTSACKTCGQSKSSDVHRVTDQDLSALEAMEKSATPGEWKVDPMTHDMAAGIQTDAKTICIGAGDDYEPDFTLIAAMRNALPALIAEVRESREALMEIFLECEGDVDGAPDRSRLSGLCNVICRLVPESITEEAIRKAKGD